MKKTAAFLAALVLVLSLSLSALADVTDSPDSMIVSFEVPESYTVTIPSKLELGTNKSATADITVNPKLGKDKELRVFLNTSGWKNITYYNGDSSNPSPAFGDILTTINYSVPSSNGVDINFDLNSGILRSDPTYGVFIGGSTGTETKTIEAMFSTTEADADLAPGTYSYTQTFKIAVVPSVS